MPWRNSPLSHYNLLLDTLSSDSVKAGFTQRRELCESDNREFLKECQEKGEFNLALHVKDNPDRVIGNRKKLCTQLGIPFEAYTCAEQVHGNKITPVTLQDRGKGRLDQREVIPESDALITREPGVMLNIFVADCVPIILYDKINISGGVCHAGWRGTSQNILYKTVKTMNELYETDPAHLTAWIGPSIGKCCYKVGEIVRSTFEENFSYDQTPFYESEGDLYCDLKSANHSQLLKAGLKKENIHTNSDCTCCKGEEYFSYRKSGEQAGRFSAFFYIKN